MGFRGFYYYLKKNNLVKEVDIFEEVSTWKRRNPDKTPILVVDFKSLAYCVTSGKSDYICGGRHQVTINQWENILKQLKSTGCDLVFFSDLNMTPNKIDTWMNRQNALFKEFQTFYNDVSHDRNFKNILKKYEQKHLKPPNSTHHDMEVIARKYGEFHYSVSLCENDLELARYAMENNALAVISNDFDFLIFDGSWRFWSSTGITEQSLKVTDYSRDGLLRVLNLNRQEMPLFATVLGNDFIKKLVETIDQAADLVRNKSLEEILSEFPDQNIDLVEIQKSLNAYEINCELSDGQSTDDSYEIRLLKSKNKIYKYHMVLMSPVQGISLLFYDMNDAVKATINLSTLIWTWTQRKIGILHDQKRRAGDSFEFKIAIKADANQPFAAIKKSPVYPDPENVCVPSLEQLYSENQCRSLDLIETKWNILKWIMSFTESEISTLRKVKKQYRVICAALCALVKVKLLDAKEADGILCTEYEISDGIQDYVIHPTELHVQCVRAAHKYNIVFSYVRENFAIAGLLSDIEELMKFDGVYFQILMTKFIRINNADRYTHMKPIKNGVMNDDESKFDLF